MAEDSETQDTGAEASGAGIDPFAAAVALGGASRGEADAFLRDQRVLIDEQTKLTRLQARELAHELKLRHWSLQVRHVSGLLKLALEVSLALIAIALACFIGATVWSAAHADGLIIDTFSVPSDLAARGVTGQAIAGQLMDKLSEMQSATVANRAPRSYSNDWGNNINLEIPETGISVGEAYRFLKSWLGHETHLSGDVWRTGNGLAIVARVSDGGSTTVTGTETDLDGLVQKTAEGIYSRTQPFRYAIYLDDHGRRDEAMAIFKSLATTGDPNDRGWAYLNLVQISNVAEVERLFNKAQQYGVPQIASNHAGFEDNLGRSELAMAYYKEADELLRSGSGDFDPRLVPAALKAVESSEHALLADYFTSAQERAAAMVGGLHDAVTFPYVLAGLQIDEHDLEGARNTLENSLPSAGQVTGTIQLAHLNVDMQMAAEAGAWETALADAEAMTPIFQKNPVLARMKPTRYDPLTAVADAQLGKFADAEQHISPTPADCYPCLMARARIAALQGQNARADWWYARAVQADPSIPLAESDWGRSLLERGQPDVAIGKFTLANQKGPHFADPLEGWGEALMKKNRSDLALAKFEEAEKYAPNWGRLHLKWGEALFYAGKKEEAQKQFALAAGLDFSAADKAELAKVSGHG